MDLTIKKRVNKNQKRKYAQYGYHDSGQTKESRVDFETLMASLNKIGTDLTSLSITVEKLKHDRHASHGSQAELRDFINHAIEAKKHLKSISFQTFVPSEIDQVKTVYEFFIKRTNSTPRPLHLLNSNYLIYIAKIILWRFELNFK